ncbi:nucleotidyltransferase family protein [Sulfolobus acidocaldarius]|uniref:Putative mannose-1-phosphate guanyltransferase n=4 Tax=Sulfolobus acidocaldarius TaxID=2285 RepID=MPG1_SULAC|nr:NDP-sugar synthase [Sulfolobus acidocaldarius]P37820.2 RecName: Full=Putative mannose-1-phosphate guanyltransferase; AltName: Full=ATP-mannose-1-phosphate guanylyltransferase; AltName: Full=GDP-mannose pyrophosphorylase; AltName: Full=NDP-hexose pyrophosphorylase [Sulfolobus acidocaldarius DSM 639]AAY79615.1 mannose-1-phosphate guanyltransferase [Sulfolobus acidocaldarius DSM 639]AGE70169.1 mannose-1-phosphate guanyltransferase [Sulfolobus acidocaldarius N8]AGE72444.1 mannose-1-phosphate gua
MVSAIVLAGGYATRLRPLSLTKPKALLPVLGKPLMDYTLYSLASSDVDTIYLSLRVMADKVLDHVKQLNLQKNIVSVIEESRLGDAGPLKFINSKYNLSDDVIVVYGDIYAEIDFNKLLEYHQSKGCNATLTATQVEDPSRYGVLITDGHRLIQIIEKPKTPLSNLVNAGIYVFKKELLNKIDGLSISRDFLPKLLVSDTCVSVYPYKGLWMDIGVPRDYMRINLELLTLKYPKGFISQSAKVSEKAELFPPFYIGDNTTVGEGSSIRNSIIGVNNRIGNGSCVEESILMNDVMLGDFSLIKESVIGDEVSLGKWNRVDGAIIGDGVLIHDQVFINRDTIILPDKEVAESVYDKGKIIL